MKIKLKFAGQLLPCVWEPDYFCINETDGIERGQKVMLIEDLNADIPDGLCVYAFKKSPRRVMLCYHTEFNNHFIPIVDLRD